MKKGERVRPLQFTAQAYRCLRCREIYVKTCRFPGKVSHVAHHLSQHYRFLRFSGHIVLSNIKPRAFNRIMPYLHFVLKNLIPSGMPCVTSRATLFSRVNSRIRYCRWRRDVLLPFYIGTADVPLRYDPESRGIKLSQSGWLFDSVNTENQSFPDFIICNEFMRRTLCNMT